MRKSAYTLLCLAISLVGILHSELKDINPKKPLSRIKSTYHVHLDAFESEILKLEDALNSNENGVNKIENLQNRLLETRLAFKNTELLFSYFDPYGVAKQINAAPLPKVEPKVAEINILQPKGLQVLDELIFSESVEENLDQIKKMVVTLKADFSQLIKHQKSIKIDHRHVFEAAREQLIRIFTLGISGFDTPGSQNAIEEAKVSLSNLQQTMEVYYPLLEDEHRSIVFQMYGLFEIGQEMLKKAENFEVFDRFEFLNVVINPLFEMIQRAHYSLGIETINEIPEKRSAMNFFAKNIFDEDFLVPNYYSNLNIEEDVFEKRSALGKLLFFDPIISKSQNVSCASCHKPELAFSDGQKKSMSSNGEGVLQRNSPTLINSVFAENYFYDLREPVLERQIKHVVMDHKEFDTSFAEIVKKLEQSKEYTHLFNEAFKDNKKYALSNWSISNAISCYVSQLNSFNSEFDQYVRYETTSIDPDVKKGFNLFMGKAACGTCHFAPTFSGLVPPLYNESESEVLGVPVHKDSLEILDTDKGRYNSRKPIDQNSIQLHSFKTTTVRNADLTAPYMHNGVFDTLEELIEFYNEGGGNGRGMNLENQTLPEIPLNLNEKEKGQIIRFLEALSDNPFSEDRPKEFPKFESQPEWNERK